MGEVRLALGLTKRHREDDDVLTDMDLREALARLDPQGSGRLPLGRIKAALQGLGLAVGRVPRASWLDLTGRYDIFWHAALRRFAALADTVVEQNIKEQEHESKSALLQLASSVL